MIRAVVVLGRLGAARVLFIGSGYTDDGVPYEMLAHSQRVAPAGEGGDCMFPLLYVTTRHYDRNVSVWITPVIDGFAYQRQRVDLIGTPGSLGEVQTHKVGLSQPYNEGRTERIRSAPRGTWFEAQVETRYSLDLIGAPWRQVVEAVELEYEILRSSAQAVPQTP